MAVTVQAAVLGVVQGLTEFLPVSSTAHLILARAFFGWDADQFGLAFDVACHVGTLVAVVAYFWRDLIQMVLALPVALSLATPPSSRGLRAFFTARGAPPPPGHPSAHQARAGDSVARAAALEDSSREASAWLIWLLVAGTIPAVVVGLLAGDVIEGHLRTVPVAAGMLALVALGLLWAERAGTKTRDARSLTLVDALWIGCAQAAALVPGVSRSGATLVAALLVGLSRHQAARFIFLLSIPAILGAAVKEAPALARGGLPGGGAVVAVGVATSATVGYLAVRYFIRYVAGHSLDVFAWYRLALAGVAVAWLLR